MKKNPKKIDYDELFLGSQIGRGQVQGMEGEGGKRDFRKGSAATPFRKHMENRFNKFCPTCKKLHRIHSQLVTTTPSTDKDL